MQIHTGPSNLDVPGLEWHTISWKCSQPCTHVSSTEPISSAPTYSHRHLHRQSSEWYTSSRLPNSGTSVGCRYRLCSDCPWLAAGCHFSSQRHNRRAASTQIYTIESVSTLDRGDQGTCISPVLQTNGCDPSSGQISGSLNGRVYVPVSHTFQSSTSKTYIPHNLEHDLRHNYRMTRRTLPRRPNII
jgi:hypothetical protein